MHFAYLLGLVNVTEIWCIASVLVNLDGKIL